MPPWRYNISTCHPASSWYGPPYHRLRNGKVASCRGMATLPVVGTRSANHGRSAQEKPILQPYRCRTWTYFSQQLCAWTQHPRLLFLFSRRDSWHHHEFGLPVLRRHIVYSFLCLQVHNISPYLARFLSPCCCLHHGSCRRQPALPHVVILQGNLSPVIVR